MADITTGCSQEPERHEVDQRLLRIEEQLAALSDRITRLECGSPAATRTPDASPQPVSPRVPPAARPIDAPRRPPVPAEPLVQPPPPRPRVPAAAPGRAAGADLRAFLKKINMLPPSGTGSMEAQIGQWWVSRIGALLFVIGTVLGITFLTRNTAPWIRFIELTAGAVGITFLGLWLERRVQRFGAVVFGMGLALLYFAAFAAYALPAVKVLHSPAAGTAAQLVVVALIVAAAFWRNSSATATMAVLLGYVACLFSFSEGLAAHALTAALVLGAAAAILYLHRGWAAPYLNAVPWSYVVLAAVAVGEWVINRRSPDTMLNALAWPLAFMVLYGATDAAAKSRGTLMTDRMRRLAQVLNTTGALSVAWLVTAQAYPEQLPTFYFLFGGILVAASAIYWGIWQRDVLMEVYFVKGTALVTLGLIAQFDAKARWTALAVESLVLLFSAVRSRLKLVEGAMALTWVASFLFFVADSIDPARLPGGTVQHWNAAWTGTLYVILSAVFLCLQARWLGQGSGLLLPAGNPRGRDLLNGLYALALGIAGVLAAGSAAPEACLPAATLAMALTMGAVALLAHHWIAWVAALLPFAHAHLTFWDMHAGGDVFGEMVWMNGLLLAGVTAALGVAATLRHGNHPAPATPFPVCRSAAALTALWTYTTAMLLIKTLPVPSQVLTATLLSLALAAAGLAPRLRGLLILSALPTAWMAALTLREMSPFTSGAQPDTRSALLWLAVAAALLHACTPALWKAPRKPLLSENARDAWEWVSAILACLVALIAMRLTLDGIVLMTAFGTGMVVLTALVFWPGLRPGVGCALAFMAAAVLQFLVVSAGRGALSAAYLPAAIALALVALGYAIAVRRLPRAISPATRPMVEWTQGIAALGILFIAFYARRDGLQTYVTVLWGVSAVGLLVLGFLTRVRAFRLVALAGLALCVGRAFAVDIRETIDRIFAFLALGGGLLLVGFLYTRYRHVIERIEGSSPDNRPD